MFNEHKKHLPLATTKTTSVNTTYKLKIMFCLKKKSDKRNAIIIYNNTNSN